MENNNCDNKFLTLCKKYNVKPFCRDDIIYKKIENFRDYEYTYCIAYEMLIRSYKYKTLVKRYNFISQKININEFDKKNKLISRYKDMSKEEYFLLKFKQRIKISANLIQKMAKLGLYSNSFLGLGYEDGNVFQKINLYNKNINNPYNARKINEFEDGLQKLIYYYSERNELYTKNKDTENYIKTNIDQITALFNFRELYIPSKQKNEPIFISLNNDDIFLKDLQEDFILFLKEEEKSFDQKRLKNVLYPLEIDDNTLFLSDYSLTRKNIFVFSRPKLLFKEAKLVNIPINLNLSKKELLLYILKIKNDYENNRDVVKNTYEYVFDTVLDNDYAKTPSKMKDFPDKKELFKENISAAFYIFDLFELFISLLKKERQEKEEEEKSNKKKKIALKLKRKEVDLNYDVILDNIEEYSGFSYDKIKKYLSVMKEFINGINKKNVKNTLKKAHNLESEYDELNAKYKNLIIGNSFIVKNSLNDINELLKNDKE